MKKFLKTILFLCALSSIAYAEDDAMAILNKKRAEIEKAEKAKAKLAKEAEEKARKEAEEQAKAQVAESVETVEAPAEAVVATESLNPQDEKEAMVFYTDWKRLREIYDESWSGMIQTLSQVTKAFDVVINPSENPALGCYVNDEMFEEMKKVD